MAEHPRRAELNIQWPANIEGLKAEAGDYAVLTAMHVKAPIDFPTYTWLTGFTSTDFSWAIPADPQPLPQNPNNLPLAGTLNCPFIRRGLLRLGGSGVA
ncbi:hypothetical protein HUW62_12470 [Myxococcus sp. AM011]|uniref:hypothetical protein n=1 Tax=Myxococcus sp. AM011 TaxID=2745200 RepID=UPI0015961DB8|nr:hypothetical protein [Myxococcus sp. AM011]NVJ22033.1 hypothetical protein [Myxococcus sp. AM011]